ncbi:MAG TPA: triose-phosphate isomerase [Longimicrobiaceae bacterium]|nr:triose-phosphate isomerase [Longimicrobiaceae bacterium]
MPLAKPVLAGNWKMHKGPTEAREFFASFLELYPLHEDRTVAFFPPAISLQAARAALGERTDILLGVQNIYWEKKGAFTGEASAGMAAEAGAQLVLVGHSERRHVFGETTEETVRKVRAALDADLQAMLCVGETLDERRAGNEKQVVREQLGPVLENLSAEDTVRLSIAYEPVWAIGTGETASPEDAAAMHRSIREQLRQRLGADAAEEIPILYGGSVSPDNARELLAQPNVDGVLVGGASLDPQRFAAICQASP